MAPYILLTVCLVLGFALSLVCCGLMRKVGVVDAPDGVRKLQDAPVPRLGGVGVMAALAIIFAAAGLVHAIAPGWLGGTFLPGAVPALWAALGLSACLGLIGALDDIIDLQPTLKLVLILIVCIGAPLLGVAAPQLSTPFGTLTSPALLIAGSALWLVVFSNAANFMDGSNGLSLGSLAIMFAGLGTSLALTGHGSFPPGLVAVIGAILGFLVYNMRGRLYAGDAGAFGLGGLFAALGLVSGLPVWTLATLALPFLVDILLTLAARARRGQSLLQAHSDHAYQGLIKSGWSHWEVAGLWWGLTVNCAIAATLGVIGGGALPFILFWTLTLALSVSWLLVHRLTGEIRAGP